MPIEDTPWFIGASGVQHPAEVARAVAYAATGGTSGVIGQTDCKIAATATPSNRVVVYPGAASIVSNYSGATAQAYVGVVRIQDHITIDPTTSSGPRSDLIVAQITDPQYGATGFDPNNPNDFKFFNLAVVKGVAAGTKKLYSQTPAIALARIDIPASTATITNAMITDLRQMAVRRSDIQLRTYFPGNDQVMSTGSYSAWGGLIAWFDVPRWATQAHFTTTMSSIEYIHAGTIPSVAGIRGSFGTINDTQNTVIIQDRSTRFMHTHMSLINLDSSFQDMTVGYSIPAVRTRGSGTFQFDYQTSIQVSAHFQEDRQ